MAIDEIPHPAASSTAPETAGAGDTRRMRGSNHMGMRQFNERIVLQAIRHHGAIPKADLARMHRLFVMEELWQGFFMVRCLCGCWGWGAVLCACLCV